METVIKSTDHYRDCLKDSVNGISKSDRESPKGFVEIYDTTDNKKELLGKENLVLYQGREFIGERIFNTAGGLDAKDMFISWFGIGSGGAPVGNPLIPTAPASADSGLSDDVPFNGTSVEYGDFRGSLFYKHPFDLVAIEQDPANYDRMLIVKVTTSIGVNDCNGYNLNEAGLYVSSSKEAGHAGPFHIFSKICFPTIVKDSSRSLMFIWYIYV